MMELIVSNYDYHVEKSSNQGDGKEADDDNKIICEGENVLLTPIQKIPPEIWEKIFQNLEDSRDLINASDAVDLWKALLNPTRKVWMFDQVLPLILPHLTSKNSILSCRLACSRWHLAVDTFLIQNSFQRPASPPHLSLQKTSNRLYPLVKLLSHLKLMYNPITSLKNHIPPTPLTILGHSLFLEETFRSIHSPPLSNIPFLTRFGPQIHFLRINFINLTPTDLLSHLFKILLLVPNLLKLDLVHQQAPVMQPSSLPPDLSLCQKITPNIPKNLETLDISFSNHLTHLISILLSLLLSPKIKSLAIEPLPPSIFLEEMPSPNPPKNLVDLSLAIRQNNQWNFLSSPQNPFKSCPISRFMIHIYTDTRTFGHQVNIEPLTKILSSFKPTLKTFALQLSCDSCKKLPQKCAAGHYKFFGKKGLVDLPYLRRLSFRGTLPPSFNFILGEGVRGSLEYLHFYVDWYDRETAMEMLGMVTRGIEKGEEDCDLLKVIFSVLILEGGDGERERKMGGMIYGSNLWRLFWRLKVFTVIFTQVIGGDERRGGERRRQVEETREWEFRRNEYDKLCEKRDKEGAKNLY